MYTHAQSIPEYTGTFHPLHRTTLYCLHNTGKQTDNQVHRIQDHKLKRQSLQQL